MVHRAAEQEADPIHRGQYRVREWEIPIIEISYEHAAASTAEGLDRLT